MLAGIGQHFLIPTGMELLGQEENLIKVLIEYPTRLMLGRFLMVIRFFIVVIIDLAAILTIYSLAHKRTISLIW